MRKLATLLLSAFVLLSLIPEVKADGIPVPPIRPHVKEEHQIVLVELENRKIKTTLDLGIRNKPSNLFSLLEERVYMSKSNPFWLKTFFLPSDFKPNEFCIEIYTYYRSGEPLVKVSINGHEAYLYSPYSYSKKAYCSFISNQDFSNPQFINVSQYFVPGQYNTVEIKLNKERDSFTLYRVYLMSGEVKETVKIIIPFKRMPTWIEIGGHGLSTWQLDSPFKKMYWYGYYGDKLISSVEAPAIGSQAMRVEENVKSEMSQTEVATDVSGSFQGKVSDVLSTASLKGENSVNYGSILRLAGEGEEIYETYLSYNAYVVEVKIKPLELKRIVIRWEEEVGDSENFDYYYPLGTGKTWEGNISYTAIYVKLPNTYKLAYASIGGMEKASKENYNYYRWKFVESSPEKDLYLSIRKISEIEKFFSKYSGILVCIVFLIVAGIFIQYKNQILKRGKRWI